VAGDCDAGGDGEDEGEAIAIDGENDGEGERDPGVSEIVGARASGKHALAITVSATTMEGDAIQRRIGRL
jgi:hypothetical protein